MNNFNLPILTEKDIDRSLFDRDQRKFTRAVVDDYVIPAGGVTAGGALQVLKAMANINREQPQIRIQ